MVEILVVSRGTGIIGGPHSTRFQKYFKKKQLTDSVTYNITYIIEVLQVNRILSVL